MPNNQNTALNQLIDIRLEKLNKIKDLGYNPYPHSFQKKHDIEDIINNIK